MAGIDGVHEIGRESGALFPPRNLGAVLRENHGLQLRAYVLLLLLSPTPHHMRLRHHVSGDDDMGAIVCITLY